MYYQLFIHQDAKNDLEALWQTDPTAAARVTLVLEQLAHDQMLLDRLTQHDFGGPGGPGFHVSKWQEQWRQGKDLWRLKIWDLDDCLLPYRIVYAFTPGALRYNVLGIVPRNFNYDPNHPLSRRILAAYSVLSVL